MTFKEYTEIWLHSLGVISGQNPHYYETIFEQIQRTSLDSWFQDTHIGHITYANLKATYELHYKEQNEIPD